MSSSVPDLPAARAPGGLVSALAGRAFVEVRDGPDGLLLARGVPAAPLGALLDGALPVPWAPAMNEWVPAQLSCEDDLDAALRWLASAGSCLGVLTACDPVHGPPPSAPAAVAASARRGLHAAVLQQLRRRSGLGPLRAPAALPDSEAGPGWEDEAAMLAGMGLALGGRVPASRVQAGGRALASGPPEAFAVVAGAPEIVRDGALLEPAGDSVRMRTAGDGRIPDHGSVELRAGGRRVARSQAPGEMEKLDAAGGLTALRITGQAGHELCRRLSASERPEGPGLPFQAGVVSSSPRNALGSAGAAAVRFATVHRAGGIVHPGLEPRAGRASRPVQGVARPGSPFRAGPPGSPFRA